MTWDPRRVGRAVLALMLVGGFVVLLMLKAFGFPGVDGEILAIIATPVGTVLEFGVGRGTLVGHDATLAEGNLFGQPVVCFQPIRHFFTFPGSYGLG